jgi:hypothetical protein
MARPRHAADRGRPPARPGADRAGQGGRDRVAARRVPGLRRGGADRRDVRHRPGRGRQGAQPAGLGRANRRLSREPAGRAAGVPARADHPRAGLRRARLRSRRRRGGGARPPPGGVRPDLRRGPGGRLHRDVPGGIRRRVGELRGQRDGGPGRHRTGRTRPRRRRRGKVGRGRPGGAPGGAGGADRRRPQPPAGPGRAHRPARPGGAGRPHAPARAAPGGARRRGDRGGRPAGAAGAVGLRALRRPEQDSAGSGLAADPRSGRRRRRAAHGSAGVRHCARGGHRRPRHCPGADADRPGRPPGRRRRDARAGAARLAMASARLAGPSRLHLRRRWYRRTR